MTQIKLRRDTAANFTSKNPILGNGEPAYETDTKKLKIGDGTTAYTQLEYFSAGGGSSTDISATLPLKIVDGVISLEVDGQTIQIVDGKLTASSTAPTNMVTTDTAQTITGDKTFEGPLTFKGNTNWRGVYNNNCRMNLVDTVSGSASISISNASGNNAEYGVGDGSSYVTYFKPAYGSVKFLLNNYDDGSAENGIAPIVEIAGNLQNKVNSTNYQILTQNNVTAGENITITNTADGISIAATASSSEPPANMVTTDTKQTITGTKEFKYGNHRFIINQVAGIVGIASGTNSIWDLSTLQLNNQGSASWAVGAKSKDGYIYATSLTRNDGNSNNVILDTGNLGSYVDGTTITYANNKLSAASSSAPPTQNLKQLDLNYIGTAGTYFYSGWSASPPKHTPISGINDSFFLEIISNNGKGPENRTLQRLTYNEESSHKGASYFRTGMQGYDSSWTSWVQITPAITS